MVVFRESDLARIGAALERAERSLDEVWNIIGEVRQRNAKKRGGE